MDILYNLTLILSINTEKVLKISFQDFFYNRLKFEFEFLYITLKLNS